MGKCPECRLVLFGKTDGNNIEKAALNLEAKTELQVVLHVQLL